jgi:hypothetical protein
MIRVLLKLPIVLLFLVPLVWAGFFVWAGEPGSVVSGVMRDLANAYPESREREAIVEEAASLSSFLARVLRHAGTGASPTMRAGFVVSAVHSVTLFRALPLFLGLLAAGVTAGLILRERMRDAQGYASPTAAGIARALVGAGLFSLGLFGLTPIGVSFAWVYAATLAACLGSAIYSANLPLKL